MSEMPSTIHLVREPVIMSRTRCNREIPSYYLTPARACAMRWNVRLRLLCNTPVID